MANVFEKLNLGNRQEIVVLHAPESFATELAKLPAITIHHHLESVAEADFWLAFATRKSEVDKLAPQIAKRARAMPWCGLLIPRARRRNTRATSTATRDGAC